MKVSFKSEGGIGFFPALNKPVEIDSKQLPEEEASTLEKLVNEASFFSYPEKTTTPGGAADFKIYTIAIENEGQQHKVEVSDVNAKPEIKNLVSFLRQKQKESRGK